MKNYKPIISSAIISDVLDEMGYCNQMFPLEIKPNFLEAKIFGRARTMKLKPIKKNDSYKDVYNGLYFLEKMNSGEVLIVANGFPNFAFFGELMSTLAKYKGVEGVVVDGCTRDYIETVKMQYPVFSRINYARDIKKRGIIDCLDVPVKVGEVIVHYNDLILGDCDGVVLIPKNIENEVLSKSIKVAKLEDKIKRDILKGIPIKQILNKRGEF